MLRWSALAIVLFLSTAHPATAQETYDLDSNVAYYAGETLDYIIYAPRGYQMVTTAAQADGYSCAFIPEGQGYDSADILIGVNIYKIRGLAFTDILARDTAAFRRYYGPAITIQPVAPITNRTGASLTTFYLNDTTAFLPHVMVSYFDGGTELVIFELVIDEDVVRVKAEDVFIACLQQFKTLRRGELGRR